MLLRGVEGHGEKLAEEDKKKIEEFVQKQTGKKTELIYTQNTSLAAGYRITVEDLQLDASVEQQLNNFKQSIVGE